MSVVTLLGPWLVGTLATLSLTTTPLSAAAMTSTAPAPHVLAWASFLVGDGPLSSTTVWSSGEAWNPLVGNWAQVDHAAGTTRSTANARAVASVPSAGSTARVVATVASRAGAAVRAGGVVAAAATTGTRVALVAIIGTDGSLEIRRVTGGGGSSSLLAASTAEAATSAAVEISLQVLDGVATATLRPLAPGAPITVVSVVLTPAQVSELATNSAYGVMSHSTTDVALRALRVEVAP
jgi:hypothetical protein